MKTINIITLVIALLSAGFSIYTWVSKVQHDKKQATITAFNTLQNEALDKLYFYTDSQITEIATKSRSEEYKKLSLYLTRIEHFSVGVNTRIYDVKTAYRLAGEALIPTYMKLKPLIDYKRKVYSANNVYDDFELLYNKLLKIKGS